METRPKPGRAVLMHGMAERFGADVERAAQNGDISRAELEGMVTRCGQCTRLDACIMWMLAHPGHTQNTPEYCLNQQELQYVRALQNQILAE